MQAFPNKAPRILISRLSHIGDCILTIPVANAVRDRFPNAWIAWAIESPGDRLIGECQAVDQVIPIPKGWLKKPLQTWRLRKKLRSLKFDICLDPQSLTKSAGIGWLSGAKIRMGLAPPLGRELAPRLNNLQVPVSSRHVVDRSVEMLKELGISEVQPEFRLTIPSGAAETALQITSKLGLENNFVVINPGAGWKSRQWSNERFGRVAKFLLESCALTPIVTWFGDAEERMADEIVTASGRAAVKVPATRLWELAGLIRKSAFYVGCDTGPTHLAAAVGTPCVTLFGTTEPEVSGPYEDDPDRPRHICVQKYYQSGTSRERRKGENHAMMAIETDEVCDAVLRMSQRLKCKNVA
ncbi:MAG: glycosyltransferase family 9 protein [Planctomycetota bacterium]|nr:glycosyltransferase family 9 protein [Planctomycetota bacterium]